MDVLHAATRFPSGVLGMDLGSKEGYRWGFKWLHQDIQHHHMGANRYFEGSHIFHPCDFVVAE